MCCYVRLQKRSNLRIKLLSHIHGYYYIFLLLSTLLLFFYYHFHYVFYYHYHHRYQFLLNYGVVLIGNIIVITNYSIEISWSCNGFLENRSGGLRTDQRERPRVADRGALYQGLLPNTDTKLNEQSRTRFQGWS